MGRTPPTTSATTATTLYRRSHLHLLSSAPRLRRSWSTSTRRTASSSCFRRDRSNTPLQALQLLNDVQYFEAARGLATRMMGAAPEPAERVAFAYRVVLSRAPAAEEIKLVDALYQRSLAKYQKAPTEAAAAVGFGESPPPDGLDISELAAWTAVANLIFNLDESIVRN